MNINSPVFQFIDNLVDFIVLNLVFLITCLPLFTIGAALTAMYDVTMREAREEGGYIVKGYLNSFKKNFKQATIAFIIHFIIGALLIFNLIFWKALNTTTASIVLGIVAAMTIIWFISFLFTYSLIARFDNTIKHTLKNSLLVPFVNLKKTILLLAFQAIVFYLLYTIPEAKIFMVVLGFSFILYCNSILFVKIFKPFETKTVEA
ncbi:hypothetical protein lbkm_4034 [Lachnospiraceae bacterium KM106-2]|nr:hypothetical protein lbkm_4034 [Lachnospiraceae bacterium KM106-2]